MTTEHGSTMSCDHASTLKWHSFGMCKNGICTSRLSNNLLEESQSCLSLSFSKLTRSASNPSNPTKVLFLLTDSEWPRHYSKASYSSKYKN